MNMLPTELKRLVVDFVFEKEERYASFIPSEATTQAMRDLQQLVGLRVLCSGDASFLGGRFKSVKSIDAAGVMEARANLVRSIMHFKYADVRFFRLPALRTERRSLHRFCDICNMPDRTESISAQIIKLQRRQKVLLRRSRS